MSVLDCCTPCATPQVVNVDGPKGEAGIPGLDGADGTMGAVMGKTVSPDPASNLTSAAQLMMGLAGSITLTGLTPRLVIIVTGVMWATTASTGQIQLRYGTGAAPINGAAATGTVVGAAKNTLAYIQSSQFGLCGVVLGLSPGVPYWIDVGLARSATLGRITDVDIVAIEG